MTAAPATDESQEVLGEVRRRGIPLILGRALWIANLVLLLSLVVWIIWDAKFAQSAIAIAAHIHGKPGGIVDVGGRGPQIGMRLVLLWILVVAAIVTMLGLFMTLFAGATALRRLRTWFAFTMLVAAWLAVLVSWRELSWQGQRLRLWMKLDNFDSIAESLRADWPAADGERAGLGTFMAYPQGNPRMLMMLTSDTNPPVSAVERADDGALGFELRGDPDGTWLEWHPAGSTPRGFVGGLENEYDFGRAAPLGRGWYLVRYR